MYTRNNSSGDRHPLGNVQNEPVLVAAPASFDGLRLQAQHREVAETGE